MLSEQRREISKNMVNENHWDHIFSNCPNLKTLSLSYLSLNNNGFSKVQHTSLENLNIINTGMNLPYLSRMSKNLPPLKNLDIINSIFSMKPAKPPPNFFSIHLPSSSLDRISISFDKKSPSKATPKKIMPQSRKQQ